jgi:hypothetical protein
MPELVEKNEPPMIVKIKKINDKFFGLSFREMPILETLLDKDKNNFIKLLSKFKKNKKNKKTDEK